MLRGGRGGGRALSCSVMPRVNREIAAPVTHLTPDDGRPHTPSAERTRRGSPRPAQSQRRRRRPRQLVTLHRNVDRPEVVGLHHDAPRSPAPRASPRPASPAADRRPRSPASRSRRARRVRGLRAPLRRRASRRAPDASRPSRSTAIQSSPSGRIQPTSSPSSRRCGVQSAGITPPRVPAITGPARRSARRGAHRSAARGGRGGNPSVRACNARPRPVDPAPRRGRRPSVDAMTGHRTSFRATRS